MHTKAHYQIWNLSTLAHCFTSVIIDNSFGGVLVEERNKKSRERDVTAKCHHMVFSVQKEPMIVVSYAKTRLLKILQKQGLKHETET